MRRLIRIELSNVEETHKSSLTQKKKQYESAKKQPKRIGSQGEHK